MGLVNSKRTGVKAHFAAAALEKVIRWNSLSEGDYCQHACSKVLDRLCRVTESDMGGRGWDKKPCSGLKGTRLRFASGPGA